MNEVEKVIEIAGNEIGYLEKASNSNLDDKTANAGNNNFTKYAKDLDNIPNFYNGRKNGYAWCDVFVDWCFVQAYGVDRAKQLLNQPNNSLGASCTASMNYYKNANRFFTSPQKGDQIFFRSGNDIVHTGIVYFVDNSKVYTIEGNTSSSAGVVANGGSVQKKSYALNSNYIAGYGRPQYKNIETEEIETNIETNKEEFNMAKTYKNGSTREDVFAETSFQTKTGSLNQWEQCECLDVVNGAYLVKYKVDGTNTYKTGFCKYNGGVK